MRSNILTLLLRLDAKNMVRIEFCIVLNQVRNCLDTRISLTMKIYDGSGEGGDLHRGVFVGLIT